MNELSDLLPVAVDGELVELAHRLLVAEERCQDERTARIRAEYEAALRRKIDEARPSR